MNRSSSNDSKRSDTEDSNNFDSTSSDYGKPMFVFPPAPRLCKSANNTSCSVSCQSDSSISDGKIVKTKKKNRKRNPKILPSIGVFWDIENCQVPKNKSASSIVQKIRELFFDGYREAEFIVVCDVKKENAQVIQDLHDAQVNLIHVSSTSKNAADEKLRQSLRRFADTHPAPSAVILISGDINFAGDLSDLRYRKKIHVILVHNSNVADALILCANETYSYSSITENLPVLKHKTNNQYDVLIANLPRNYDKGKLKHRLKYLSDNCGGRVLKVDNEHGTAVLRFSSFDFASRAQRRLKGEDVFGYSIRVSNPANSRDSPCRNFTGRKIKGSDVRQVQPYTVPPPGYSVQDTGLYYQGNQSASRDNWKSFRDQSIQAKPSVGLQENVFRPVRCLPNLMNISHEQIRAPQHNSFAERRNVTPQEELGGACGFSFQSSRLLTANFSDFNDENKIFHQISNSFQNSNVQGENNSPVELVISSLDPSIDIKDLRRILLNLLKEYVTILSLNVSTQADGSPIAILKVDSQQQARYAISQLHHYKLGYKRITISYAQNNMLDTNQLKEMVIALLQEVPGHRMPLFKLIELLESRFHINVSVSEVNKLKDVCRITDELGGRIIALTPEVRNSPPANLNRTALYCTVHCPNGIESRGWGEAESSQLPNINMSLRSFATKLNQLLSSHMGTLPLLSLSVCYQVEFGDILPSDDNGVPLEHLVTCVNNVELKYGGPSHNIKYIKRETDLKPPEHEKDEALLKSMSPSIVSNIQLLSRELVDLLKTTNKCQLLLGRFIPAYHHHFGRQCRVADYGYTKLVDLLESKSIAGIVQILGEGAKRVITLTHSTQIRRFTSDLLRVLKGQISKQVTVAEFPSAYERTMGKSFNAVEYGLCNFEDLLEEIPENTVVITKNHDAITIAIPKREQTAEEIARTKQFAEEVVKLLCHSPQCSMLFNKFVPAYHHHFGHQCKVSDYGFTKLIELFEAIPDTVQIEDLPDGDRKVSLTLPRALKVLGNQITDIIRQSKLLSLPEEALAGAYLREFGYPLKPRAYECNNIKELVSKLSDFIQVVNSSAGPLLVLVAPETQATIIMRIWAILVQSPHTSNLSIFINEYRMRFQSNIPVSKLEQMKDVVSIFDKQGQHISLTPFYILAAQLYQVVYRAGGQVPYTHLENMYRRNFDKSICYADYNVMSMDDLISHLNFVLLIRGTRRRTNIVLNQRLVEFGIPLPTSNSTENGQFYKKETAVIHWPPPPAHDLVLSNTDRGITPPKPDTPPEPGWSTPQKSNVNVDIYIPLQDVQIPQLKGFAETLISPTRHLLCADTNPLGSVPTIITPPHPMELPMPDKLLLKDDSNDSGVINNSNITSENEMDVSAEQTGAKPKIGSNYTKAFLTYNM